MKKRNMPAILLLVCILLTLLCSAAVAEIKEDVVADDGQTYTIDTEAKTAILTKAIVAYPSTTSKSDGVVTIPDSIVVNAEKYLVTAVAEEAARALYYNHIYIGANVCSIAEDAFVSTDWPGIVLLQFNGNRCTNIASGAFGFSDFTSNFQVVVCGEDGCMDAVLAGVSTLPKTYPIIYENPAEANAAKTLQQKINEAQDNVETTIQITENMLFAETIKIPANKKIILTDDGSAHTLKASLSKDVDELFYVKSGASLTFDGNLTFYGGNSNNWNAGIGKGNIVTVHGTFKLKNGTLSGKNSTISISNCAAVWVGDNAQFDMTGGSISEFNLPNKTLTAAVVVGPGSTFNMSGGSITKNKNSLYYGDQAAAGGVLLYTWDKDDPVASMNLSGNAVISYNEARCGAGIYLTGNTDLQMTGGTISGNKAAYSRGGGVCVAGENGGSNVETTRFTMTGGTISGNTARYGGGVFVNSQYVTLKGGNITGNTATEHGGGIYVSETPYTVHLENVVIKENTATIMGGGLWLCPTGFAEIHVTNGGAIYNNVAAPAKAKEGEEQKPITDAAGDDIASIWWIAGEGKGLTLAERMLGGGKIDYYNDGVIGWSQTVSSQFAANETGKVAEGSQRFDPANPGAPLSNKTNNTENLALISVASDDAKALAEKNAKLVISGNTAPRGGGIGSNGGVIIGKKDETTYSLIIKKDWGNTAQSLWQEVTLQLVIDGNKLDEVQLNSGNEWTAKLEGFTLENLQGHTVMLEEKNAPAGFKLSVSELTYDKEKRTFAITATNVYTPEVPNKPEIEIPKTGDSSHIGLMLAAMAASLLGLLACALAGKRRGNR